MEKATTAVVRHSPGAGKGPDVWSLHDPDTGSVQYVCADPATRQAALIDVVWNYDPRRARLSTESARLVLELVRSENLEVAWILDTHPHADHVTAADLLRGWIAAPTATGAGIRDVAALWSDIYNLPDLRAVGHGYDRLLMPGDVLPLGDLDLRVMASPGHTLFSRLISRLTDDDIARAQANYAQMDSVGQSRMAALHGGRRDRLEVAPNLWAGVGLVRGGAGTALVGDPETVAARMREYQDLAIESFVMSGYPHLEEAIRFAELVFPLIGKEAVTLRGVAQTGGAFDVRARAAN